MVDLVKIRKKARQKKEDEQSAVTPAQPPESSAPAGGTATGEEQPLAAAGDAASGPGAPDGPPATASLPAGQPAAAADPVISKLEKFKAEAGKRREQEFVEEVEEAEGQLERLTFLVAGEAYAVDIEKIVEIVTPRAVTRVPNADPEVVGIVSLRGTVVTLIDIRRKLGHPPAGTPDEDTRVIVADLEHDMVGFIVDEVLRVVKVVEGEIEPHPVVHSAELNEAVRGVFRSGDALTILLDLDKLLDHSGYSASTA